MKKLLYLLVIVSCFVACKGNQPTEPSKENPINYVDLGLPSGTLWKNANELNYSTDTTFFFRYSEAIDTFSTNVPTIEQWAELMAYCEWSWKKDQLVLNKDSVWTKCPGLLVKGLNGASIFLPAMGGRSVNGDESYVGIYGEYWTSSIHDSEGAKGFSFCSEGIYTGYYLFNDGLSVRLVMKPNDSSK